MKKFLPALSFLLMVCGAFAGNASEQPPISHSCACDGSAAVAVNDRLFISASDEDSILRIFDGERPGDPTGTFDLQSLLSLSQTGEMDIEGATRIGQTVYFISSHARSKKGRARPEHQQLFALTLKGEKDGTYRLQLRGKVYRGLSDALAKSEKFSQYLIDDGRSKKDRKAAPGRSGSLNVEGLCSWKSDQLLIGFRSPNAEGKALLLPLQNPLAVMDDEQQPVFGEPIKLDLGGLYVRGIEYWAGRGQYVIAAGSEKSHGQFRIYLWDGDVTHGAKLVAEPAVDAESVVTFPNDKKRVLLLSDDSGDESSEDGSKCKDLPIGSKGRSFRTQWISIP